MVKWLQSNTAYSVLRGAYWKTELRGAGKRAGTELHPSRARAGTELRLTFARLCSALLAIARLLAGSFFSQEYRAKQNSGRLGFLPKNGAKPFAFRRFPSLRNRKDFLTTNGHQTGQARSFKFQVPSSKPERGGRWSAFVHESPRKSPFVRLLHEELFLRGRKGGWIAEFKNQETKAAFCFNTERYSPNVHLNGDGNQSS